FRLPEGIVPFFQPVVLIIAAYFVSPLKNITPHKLRSTYGTSLYRVIGDIYLVADVLGHTDVNTTRKHYAAIEEDRRRNARDVVKLRIPIKSR
uniref:tyrosine-type recombinase/integrase n=1 Tax=Lacrimispora sp. TaxID=2719234 RepID=UPI0028AFA7AE